jgi:hypothetical protein
MEQRGYAKRTFPRRSAAVECRCRLLAPRLDYFARRQCRHHQPVCAQLPVALPREADNGVTILRRKISFDEFIDDRVREPE